MKKIMVFILIVMIGLILISIFFSLKENFLKMEIASLNKEIYKNYNELQSLKAEWGYLNNKDYLKMMIDKHMPELKSTQNINDSIEIIKKLQ